MTSTYSTNLKLNLMGTGDQSGTWGSTTNTNLGTLIEEAIVGYVTQTVTDSATPTSLTIPNGASSNGRNYVLELTGVLTANRTVEVPAVDKPYIFYNNTTGGYTVTVKVTGQTGVIIKPGKKAIVYTNSTDVIEVANAPVTEDGAQTLTGKTMSGSSNTFSNIPFSALAGTVTVAAGGTGQTSYTDGQLLIGNTSGNTLTKATLTAGTNVSVTNGNGSITLATSSTPSFTSVSATSGTFSGSVQISSLGVGTAASGTAGEIRATNNVTAYYSDDRLKTKLGEISNALDKIKTLSGFYYEANDVAQALGYDRVREVGVSAQAVQAVLPEVVAPAPIDETYLTVRYERLVPLIIEAIKELSDQIESLKRA
jgi:hypothetical protein